MKPARRSLPTRGWEEKMCGFCHFRMRPSSEAQGQSLGSGEKKRDCPWVSEDGSEIEKNGQKKPCLAKRKVNFCSIYLYFLYTFSC